MGTQLGTHRIIEFNNGEIRRGKYPFIYQDPRASELDWMRKTEGLDEVVKGAGSEFEMIKRLAAWTAKQWMYGGPGDDGTYGAEAIGRIHQGLSQGRVCGTYCVVFADALFSFGIQSRFLSIGTDKFIDPQSKKELHYYHAVGDVWSNDYQKWVYMDGNFACYFEDENGIPQSIFELQEALLSGRKEGIRLVFCGEYAKSTAPIFKKFPHFKDRWFPYAIRSINIFHNLDLLMANNIHSPDWQPSGKGPEGEKLGAMRLYYKPARPGFSPHYFDRSHYEVTNDIRDVTWNLYDTEITIERKDRGGEGTAPLRLKTFAPFLDCFLVRENGGNWQERKPTQLKDHHAELALVWKLRPGLNTLEARTRNTRGRLGVVRRVRLSDDPLSVPPRFVGRPGSLAGSAYGSVVFSETENGFLFGPAGPGLVRKTGKPKKEIRLRGPDGDPVAIERFCIDASGNFIAVAGHTVHKFDPSGKHLLAFGSEGRGKGELMNIGGVAVNRRGQIAVSDADFHRLARVQLFSPDGKHLRTIGGYGARPGELNLPAELAFAPNGHLYVVDAGNHRVQVFNTRGNCTTQIGPEIPTYGRLRFPSGLCLARHGERELLYLVDTFNHRVLVTDLKGRPVGAFAGYSPTVETDPGKFRQPRSIAVQGNDLCVLQPPSLYTFRQAIPGHAFSE